MSSRLISVAAVVGLTVGVPLVGVTVFQEDLKAPISSLGLNKYWLSDPQNSGNAKALCEDFRKKANEEIKKLVPEDNRVFVLDCSKAAFAAPNQP